MSGRGRPKLGIGKMGKASKPVKLKSGGVQVSASLRLANGTTRRVSGSGLSPVDARKDLEANAAEVMSSWTATRISPETTISELGALWFSWFSARDRAVQTLQRYEASLVGTIRRDLGSLALGELTNGQIRAFVRAIADAGHVSEARNSRVVIRHVLAFAVENGFDRPELLNFDGFELPVPIKKARAITDDELSRLRALIEAHRDRDRPGPRSTKTHDDLLDMLDLSLATSLRISEVLAIKGAHLDLTATEQTLSVVDKIEYAKGEGYREGPTKTEATVRVIPLPPFAVDIARARYERYGDGLLFRSSRQAGGPISQNNLRNTLRTVIRGTEFHGWFTPHTARKSNLSAVNDVHGAEVAAAVAGHTDGGKLIRSTYGERRPLAPNVTDITQRFGRHA